MFPIKVTFDVIVVFVFKSFVKTFIQGLLTIPYQIIPDNMGHTVPVWYRNVVSGSIDIRYAEPAMYQHSNRLALV